MLTIHLFNYILQIDAISNQVENVSNWWNNVWFVSVVSSAVSSIIMYFVSYWVQKRWGKDEYFLNVHQADTHLLDKFRPLINDNNAPSHSLYTSVVMALAQEYKIKSDDILSYKAMADALISEILSNAFLSTEQKLTYGTLLENESKKSEVGISEIKLSGKPSYSTKIISLLLSLLTFISVLIVVLYIYMPSGRAKDLLFKPLTPEDSMVIFTTILAGVIVTFSAIIFNLKMIAKIAKK